MLELSHDPQDPVGLHRPTAYMGGLDADRCGGVPCGPAVLDGVGEGEVSVQLP